MQLVFEDRSGFRGCLRPRWDAGPDRLKVALGAMFASPGSVQHRTGGAHERSVYGRSSAFRADEKANKRANKPVPKCRTESHTVPGDQ